MIKIKIECMKYVTYVGHAIHGGKDT